MKTHRRKRYCDRCHQVLSPLTRVDARFCSTKCRVAQFRAKSRVLPVRERGDLPVDLDRPLSNSRSNVIAKTTISEAPSITPRDVIAARGLVCWLCDGVIDLTLPSNHQEALEIDHLIPASRHGAHSLLNLAPTHGICNRRKSDRFISFASWGESGPIIRLED